MSQAARLELAKRWTKRMLVLGVPLIALLFAFADRGVDTWVASWGSNVLTDTAAVYTNIGDRLLLVPLAFIGLVWAVASEWLRGPTRSGRLVLFVCVSFALALVAGDTLKYVFGRARPQLLLEKDVYGFTWFAAKGILHSFPSGHTLRVFSILAALSLRFPRLAWLLLSIASLEAVTRVLVLRHYPSDVLAGAMVGTLAALWTNAMLTESRDQPR